MDVSDNLEEKSIENPAEQLIQQNPSCSTSSWNQQIEKRKNGFDITSEENILKQITSIRESILSERESYTVDTSQNMRMLPALVQQFQKFRSHVVSAELLRLFTSMCTSNTQYIHKLCKLGILPIIRTLINDETMRVDEPAIILLGHIVNEFAAPSKSYSRGDQFEFSIRQSLMSDGFISLLINLIMRKQASETLQKAAFWCLSQYTNEINLDGNQCMQILSSISFVLNSTIDNDLIIHVCSTISRHFAIPKRIIYLIGACVVPNVISLLAHHSLQVVTTSLHVIGCIVALERDEEENVDYTEYVVDCGVVKYLSDLLHSHSREVVKETCWTISNIIAGNTDQIHAVLESDCVPQIVSLINSGVGDEVKNEAYWVFMNGATCGNDDQIDYFVQQGIIDVLSRLIDSEHQNLDVFDALDSILRVGDRRVADTHAMNPYVALMDMDVLRRACDSSQPGFQKKAETFFKKFFRQCGVCRCYFYILDTLLKFCDECNCFVCGSCNCGVYHLDYQLAQWDSDDVKKTDAKKKPKKKKKNQSKAVMAPEKAKMEKEDVSSKDYTHFQQILEVYLRDYSMIDVSKLLLRSDL